MFSAKRLLSPMLLVALLAGPGQAEDSSAFVPVWTGTGDALSAATLDKVASQCATQQAQPDHIVVLMHGYDTTREGSVPMFQEAAKRIQASFAKSGKTVLVVGLQWDSAPRGNLTPWKAGEAYTSMVPRARTVGHVPARQLILRLQKQFPGARIHIFAHSMGCEVAAATAFPEMAYTDKYIGKPAFAPKQNVPISLMTLCGSDLDYDVWYKTKVNLGKGKPRVGLMWMTMPWYAGDIRDNTLQIRKVSRGMGGGSAFPRMTVPQYDLVFKARAAVFDDKEIPQDHQFARYYSQDRVDGLAQAACSLADKSAPKPTELLEAERVLALPNKVSELQPALDSTTFTGQTYALWRMECLMDGNCRHMSDLTLEKIARLLRDTPRKIWTASEDSKCKTVHAKYWPTEKQMERAGAPSWAKPR